MNRTDILIQPFFTRHATLRLAAQERSLTFTEAEELTCLACVLKAWRAQVCQVARRR